MPHLTIEYSNNIKPEADIPGLLQRLGDAMMQKADIFPVGGLRLRAIGYDEYRIADGKADDAFLHITLKIGAGRSDTVKQESCAALFEIVKTHLAALYARRYLAISLELYEFPEAGTLKLNNIHRRFKKDTR